MATIVFALLAGVLSTLSPCVLPLLPLVLAASLNAHRFGPVALAGGLALSFVVIGLFVATIGFALDIDGDLVRTAGAVVLLVLGGVLLVPNMQARLAVAAGPVGNWTQERLSGGPTSGLGGQFAVGLLLGAVWSPCVGPTLGAASAFAARGENLTAVAGTMLAFGFGAALPLILLGFVSREVFMRWRGRMMAAGQNGKIILGVVLIAIAVLILSGFDKQLETFLVDVSPEWLTNLTTRF